MINCTRSNLFTYLEVLVLGRMIHVLFFGSKIEILAGFLLLILIRLCTVCQSFHYSIFYKLIVVGPTTYPFKPLFTVVGTAYLAHYA